MTENEVQNPLVMLYGEDAIELVLEEIRKLKLNSNVPFDNEYMKLGVFFLTFKANEIMGNKKSFCSLTSLVSESFGEAAIYKYNCSGGVL